MTLATTKPSSSQIPSSIISTNSNWSLSPTTNTVTTVGLGAIAMAVSYALIRHITSCCQSVPYRETDLTPFDKEAVEFAQKLLKENPNITPVWFKKPPQPPEESIFRKLFCKDPQNGVEPVNRDVGRCTALMNQHMKLFDGKVAEIREKNKTAERENQPIIDPRKDKEVLDLAESCMKLAYVTGCLMLEDLDNFATRNQYATKGKRLTPEQLVSNQWSYFYQVVYIVPRVYGGIRSETTDHIFWPSEKPLPLNDFQANFYKEGTQESKLRHLYNSYVQNYINV